MYPSTLLGRKNKVPNLNDTFPGTKLETYVLWSFNAIVNTIHTDPSGFNKRMATFLAQPILLERWQFDIILELFEPYRQQVEQCLCEFDSAYNSWYSYQQFAMVFIPQQIYLTVQRLLCSNFLR